MDNYMTYTALLGLRESNPTPFRDTRIQHYKSVEKMVDLISMAKSLCPRFTTRAITLDPFDPQWDDMMPFPVIDRTKYLRTALGIGISLYFYSYNYNTFTHNIRFRTFRNVFPILITGLFLFAYAGYRKAVMKVNLFDEYCWLRSQELVKQNEYLLKHEDFKRFTWWKQDLKETLGKIYRQAHDHKASDFADSELLLQDFINRYVDPNDKSPMAKWTTTI